jgi:hypothetical protein
MIKRKQLSWNEKSALIFAVTVIAGAFVDFGGLVAFIFSALFLMIFV